MNLPHLCIEINEINGCCRTCDAPTVLVTAGDWKTHPENEDDQDFVEPHGEVSGNYCPECNRIVSLFLHGI